MTKKTKRNLWIFFKWFFGIIFFNALNTASWWIVISNFLIGRDSYLQQKPNGEVVKKVESLFWDYDWSEKAILILFAIIGAVVSLILLKYVINYAATTKEKKVINIERDETSEKLQKYIEKIEKMNKVNSTDSLKKIDKITEELEDD